MSFENKFKNIEF